MLKPRTLRLLCLAAVLIASAAAQTSGTLKGVLTDHSGAVIPHAAVSLAGAGDPKSTLTQSDGSYQFSALAPGEYTVRVSYPGFARFEKAVTIAEGTTELPIQMTVTLEKQEVTVKGEPGPSVSVEPDNNASALVIKGTDLEALPDDPDDLNDMLQALAGPAAGPNGGQLFVDGFSGGQLPPKNAIREIRINQNPFSAEYDHLGFGRIEIFTKPGSDKFRGGFGVNDSDGAFNSRNPFVTNKPDYSNRLFNANLSGPLSHRASFFLSFNWRNIDNDALIVADTLDPATLLETPVRTSVVTPRRDFNIGPRVDYQLSTNHTLTARFSYFDNTGDNNGIGQYSLLSRAYSSAGRGEDLQLTETAILNPTAVNETRFQYARSRNDQFGDNALPAIAVTESFTGGGSQVGRASNLSNHFELQNNTSIGHRTHTFRFGFRARRNSISDLSPANFGGTFTFFGVGNAPVLDAASQVVTDASGAPQTTPISSLEQYRRTLLFQQLGDTAAQIRALGGGASQFSIAGGNPLGSVAQTDVGLFAQDDWRMKPNFTLSVGVRYETQSNIHDWRDFAPRLGLAWSPKARNGKPSKTVIRGGFGMFYDRVAQNLTLQALRFNGVNQRQFVVVSPDFFPNVPPLAALNAQQQPLNTYQLDQRLRAPYMLQSALSLERQLPRKTTLVTTYINVHALHALQTVNINAPLAGTFLPTQATEGVRPFGDAAGNLFRYETGGIMNMNMFLASVNTAFSKRVSLNVAYELSSANSDVDNSGMPSNPYNFRQDYGRASFQRHQFGLIIGSFLGPFGLRMNPQLVLATGAPYNLISGHDLNGDTIANDRPAFATDIARPSVVSTRFGAFDTNPLPGQAVVPRNFLTDDGMWNLNIRVGRTIAFGRTKGGGKGAAAVDPGMAPASVSLGPRPAGGTGGGGGERRFSANFNVLVNNVFNHVTRSGFVGNLSSPLFGQATTLGLFRETSNCRRIQLGTQLSF